ncbi:CASP-like protein 2C1 [Canna indica]|uniref:CASP-like protein n=1 Tax=Canna indica TaxID=4628 RepID=A0AAQ3Q8M8_9LILI|nr:CASP-like protein 2C1 [Canna indica]
MGSKLVRVECVLRVSSLVFAVMAALLLALDAQTKTILFVTKKASIKNLHALRLTTIVVAMAAGYQLLQLMRMAAFAWLGRNPCNEYSNKFTACLYLFLDQGVTYATFAAATAGFQEAFVGLFGVEKMQWMKLCNVYTRFCEQIAGGMVVCLALCVTMAVMSAVSAHRFFKLYHRSRPSPSKSDRRSMMAAS